MQGGKISEARKAELRTKIDNRDALKEQLEKQREDMRELRGNIREEEAKQMSSSATASKAKRHIPASLLTMQDELETMKLTIQRLEETYDDAVKELEDLEKLL